MIDEEAQNDRSWIDRMRADGIPVIAATCDLPEQPEWVYPPLPEPPSLMRRVGLKVRAVVQSAHRSFRRHAPVP
jgi:hypothetical protein